MRISNALKHNFFHDLADAFGEVGDGKITTEEFLGL
jgi:hypothetical protein